MTNLGDHMFSSMSMTSVITTSPQLKHNPSYSITLSIIRTVIIIIIITRSI